MCLFSSVDRSRLQRQTDDCKENLVEEEADAKTDRYTEKQQTNFLVSSSFSCYHVPAQVASKTEHLITASFERC